MSEILNELEAVLKEKVAQAEQEVVIAGNGEFYSVEDAETAAATVETETVEIAHEVVAEVEKIIAPVERLFHPESATRPIINVNLPQGGGSVVRNPA